MFTKLQNLTALDSDAFVAEVKHIRGRKLPLTAAGLQTLRQEYTNTIEPARLLSAEALGLERTLAHLVNQAYAQTPEETALLWSTAPPRMPIPKPPKNPGIRVKLLDTRCRNRYIPRHANNTSKRHQPKRRISGGHAARPNRRDACFP